MKICHIVKCSFIILLISLEIISESLSSKLTTTLTSTKKVVKSVNSNNIAGTLLRESKRPARPTRPTSASKASKRPKVNKPKETSKTKSEKPLEVNHDKPLEKHANDHKPTVDNKQLNQENSSSSYGKSQNNQNYNQNGNANTSKSSSISNYFSETSKSNQSSAGKAFAGFLLGFVLWYFSVWLIFRNERVSVIETNFIDWIKAQKYINSNQATQSDINEEFEEKKPYIVEGNLKFFEPPTIEGGLDLSFQNSTTCVVDISIQEYKINNYNNDEGQEKTTKTWNYQFNNKGHYAGKIALDNIIIDVNYKGLDIDYSNLPKEDYKGDLNNLKDFIYKEYKLPQNNIQEFKEGDKQYFYMTNDYFDIRDGDNDNFTEGDVKVEITCRFIDAKTIGVVGGEIVKYVNKETPQFLLMPIDSPLNSPAPGWFWCCFDYGTEPLPLFFCRFGANRDDHLKNMGNTNDCSTKFCRIGLFGMHFAAYYFILYPFILLLGMIPFIGAVTSFVLIFLAFLMTLISYFMILITAWIFSRPIFAILLIIATVGLIFAVAIMRKNTDESNKPKWGYDNKYGEDKYADNHFGGKRFLKP